MSIFFFWFGFDVVMIYCRRRFSWNGVATARPTMATVYDRLSHMRSDLRATRANRNDEDDHDDDDEDEDEDEDEVNEEEEEFGGANDDEYEVEQGTSLDDNDANDGDDGDDDDGQASSHAVSGEQRKSESNVARRRR